MTDSIRGFPPEGNPRDAEVIRHQPEVGIVAGRPLRHVLLVEDSRVDALFIKSQFDEAGAECTFTVHRRLDDALQELRSGHTRFDLILLDLGLPDSHGLEALHHVRAAAPRIPTIVLTGAADEQLATEALHSGAQDYLVKGQHNPHTLLRAARHAIDRTETVELRETERLKSELLSIVSHEMRTPLTVIRENISLILEGALGPVSAGQQEFIVSAVANCDRLRTMIDDLVDTAAIERGALTLLRRPFNLRSSLEGLVREQRAVFSSRQQTLVLDLPPIEQIAVFGDVDRIRQAFTNLLSNAHKSTPAGGEVCLRVRSIAREIVVEVTDNGMGIAKEALGHIFVRFSQLGREHGPGLKGAGLGLSIVRHIVERHGGSIRVESELGRGSTFTVTLPRFIEGEELDALSHGGTVPTKDGYESVLAVVRLRPGLSPDRAVVVLRRLTEILRTQLRGAYDAALLLEREQMVVLMVSALDSTASWLPQRLEQMLAEDAPALEWALCPTTDCMNAGLLAALRFEAVVRDNNP
jgi:sigma-B regulation protein RsbU (phosphoserine phosphatase)